MLRIHFTAQDLIRTTLATEPDPLWEVLLSLHLLQDNGAELVYGKWRRQVTQPAPRQHLRRLVELAPARGYSPDFLTPAKAHDNIDDALDTLVSTGRTTVLEPGRLPDDPATRDRVDQGSGHRGVGGDAAAGC